MPAADLPIPVVSTTEPIFRVAYKPDPWCPPDWSFAGQDRKLLNRFDDSEGYFRVLYAASTRLCCFVETLARYRKAPADPEFDAIASDPDHIAPGTIPASWLTTRCIGRAMIRSARIADVYHSQSVSYLRSRFEAKLVQAEGAADFDMAVLMSQRRWLTQEIATLVYTLGYNGIAYKSRHGTDLQNWAIFEPFERLKPVETCDVSPDDPDFQTALKRLDLAFDPAR